MVARVQRELGDDVLARYRAAKTPAVTETAAAWERMQERLAAGPPPVALPDRPARPWVASATLPDPCLGPCGTGSWPRKGVTGASKPGCTSGVAAPDPEPGVVPRSDPSNNAAALAP